jgi:predicted RNA binding protein YcfA (HicA-like mRNA interferase family)
LGRLRVLSGAAAVGILQANGFAEVRRKGSHIVMQKKLTDTTITVPIPDHRELRIGTLTAIIRQSRLPRDLFES